MLAAMLMAGCTSDELTESTPQFQAGKPVTTITASILDENGRTVLGDADKVLWTEGDVIRLVTSDGNTTSVADYVADKGGTTKSTFTIKEGDAPIVVTSNTVAYYPAELYDKVNECAVLPATQTYALIDGKPKFENAPMYAKADGVLFPFKNICTVLGVTVKANASGEDVTDTIQSIRVSADKAMSGKFTVGADYTAVTAETEPKAVVLNCGNEIVGTDGNMFYVAIPASPSEGYDKFVITITNDKGRKYSLRAKEDLVIERDNIYPLTFIPDFTPSTEVVDLGVSVLWASRNIGAQNPWDFGDYFAWAATEPLYNSLELETNNIKMDKLEGVEWTIKSIDWKPEKDPVTTLPGYSKKNAPYSNGYQDGTGYSKYTSMNAVLEAMDDAATVNWKGSWRMPTYMEWTELFRNCVQEKVLNYHGTNVSGVIFYKAKGKDLDWIKHPTSNIDHGPTVDIDGVQWLWPSAKETYSEEEDNHIFLPVAGRIEGQTLKFAGTFDVLENAAVHMWSANLYSNYLQGGHASIAAMSFLINDNRVRGTGMTIRPCMPRQE